MSGVQFTFTTTADEHLRELSAARSLGLAHVGSAWELLAKERVPVDTGYLRASITSAVENQRGTHAERYAGRGNKPGGTVTYQKPRAGAGEVHVGSNAEYAPAVHEDLTATRRSGGPKFIEGPLRERESDWRAALQSFIAGVGK